MNHRTDAYKLYNGAGVPCVGYAADLDRTNF